MGTEFGDLTEEEATVLKRLLRKLDGDSEKHIPLEGQEHKNHTWCLEHTRWELA